jgi:O-antigen/teichoic acid export membrane protein
VALSIVTSGLVTSVASIVLAFSWRTDAWTLLMGAMVGMLCGIVVLGIPEAQTLRVPSGFPLSKRFEILRIGLPSMITGPLYWIISSSDRWFIGFYRTPDELGPYAFASSIGLIGLVLNSSLTLTWFPEAASTHARQPETAQQLLGREWARLLTLLLIVWLAVSSAGGDAIRLFTDTKFHVGARYVPWIAAGTAFYGIASLAATGLFVARQMTPVALCWASAAVLDLVLNTLLVPPYGAYGAAIASCASYAFVAASVLWASHRRYPMTVPWTRLALVVVVVLAAGTLLVPPWNARPLLSLTAKLPVGIGVAAALVHLISPEWSRATVASMVRRAP